MAQNEFAEGSAMAELMGETPALPAVQEPATGGALEQLLGAPEPATPTPSPEVAPVQPSALNELLYPDSTPDFETKSLQQAIEQPGLDSSSREDPGFLPSVKAGWDRLYASSINLPAAALSDTVAGWAEDAFPGSGLATTLRESATAEQQMFQDNYDSGRDQPVSQTLQQLASAGTFTEFGQTFMDSPEKWTVLKEVAGGSLPYSVGLMGGVALQGLKGVAGASLLMNVGDNYLQAKEDGKSDDEAWLESFIKSPIQMGFDVAAMGIAGVPLAKSRYLDAVGQMAAQSILGGSSEVAKGEAAGTEYTRGAVALEAAAEIPGAVPEVIIRRLTKEKQGTLGEVVSKLEELIEQAAPELAPEERAALAAKQRLEIMEKILTQAGEEQVAEMDIEGLPQAVPQVELETTKLPQAMKMQSDFIEATIDVQRDGVVMKAVDAAIQPGEVLTVVEPNPRTPEHAQALKAVQRTVQRWVSTLAPDMSVYVSTGALGRTIDADHPGANLLHENSKSSGNMMVLGETGKFFIQINPDTFMNKDGSMNRGAFIETMSHEFGHGLINHTFQQAKPEVQSAVLNAYRKWLVKMTHVDAEGKRPSIHSFIRRRKGAFNGSAMGKDFIDKGHVDTATSVAQGKQAKARPVTDLYQSPAKVAYSFGFTEFVADQMVKTLGESKELQGGVSGFFKKTMKTLKRFYSRFSEEYGAEENFKDFVSYLASKTEFDSARAVLTAEQQAQLDTGALESSTESISSVITAIKKEYGADAFPEDAEGDLDTYGTALKFGGGLTHLAKENRHIAGLQHYLRLTKEWWNTKMTWTLKADETLKLWKKLGRKQGENFGRFMLDLTVLSYKEEKGFTPQDAEFQKLADKWKLGDKEIALYDLVDQDFKEVLNALEEVLMEHAERAFESDPKRFRDEVASISEEMTNLRKLNFFPLSRFGSFFVKRVALKTFTREGVDYKPGDITSFEVYETKSAAKKAHAEGDGGESRALRGKLTDMQQQFAGMPPQFIRMLKDRLDLTVDQEHELSELLNDVAPGQSFKKHLAERKVVPGYSVDAMRGYASYFMHFANHLGRIKFKFPFQDAIGQVRASADAVRVKSGEATKRDEILQHLQQHNDYILNPGNEMANLRALGFLWYLGFVPKSAVVNLTQVPLVTYPYLAARYSDAEAVSAISKATRTAMHYFRKPHAVAPEVFTMLEELKARGIIDESLATELAATSEGSVAQRLVPGTFLKSESAARAIRNAAGAGAWMFQQAEKQNRRITAIAAFDLARKTGMEMKEAINAAEDAVETTQFEYARWNRPFFAQKKRSVFFLFWQYKTNALYFALRDPGSTRYLMMMLGMAGVAGLPFSEDIMDLVDWMSKKLAKETGDADYKVNTRQKIRELAAEVGANPDLMLHGGSRYLFGLPALADLVGVPLPNVDIGGSISMGRMIPGVEPTLGQEGDVGQRLAKGGQELGGAVLSIPINMIRAIGDDNPDTLKRFEKVMPSVARNFSKAYRYVRDEADTLPNGAKIAEFDLQDSHHRTEVFLQAMGFPPTRSQEVKEKYYMVQENVRYWEVQRRSLLELWDHTRKTKDREGLKEVKKAVHDFNATVPFRGFSISGKDVSASLKNRIRQRKMIEAGVVAGERGMQVQRDVEKGFPVPDVESEELR